MALYKHREFLAPDNSAAFDTLHSPGVPAPYAGIYRCQVCGCEIGTAHGHALPPQGHHAHPQRQPISWRLVVFAQHKP